MQPSQPSSQPSPQPGGSSQPTALNAQGLPPHYTFRPAWEVTPREVKAMLDGGEAVVLVDCRTPREYEIARIGDSPLHPLQMVHQQLDELRALADRPMVIFCHHGMRSLQMASLLRQQGIADVRSMAGGIDLWSIDIDPTVPRY